MENYYNILRVISICCESGKQLPVDQLLDKNQVYAEDADFDFVDEKDEKITKRKQFALRPMTSEDAILQLEMLGHDFFVYLDSDTDSVCIVYKRNDGGYGLLEPEY